MAQNCCKLCESCCNQSRICKEEQITIKTTTKCCKDAQSEKSKFTLTTRECPKPNINCCLCSVSSFCCQGIKKKEEKNISKWVFRFVKFRIYCFRC